MAERFSNRLDWFTAGWALVVWAVHFTLLWAAGVVFPGQPAARWLALLLTLVAAAALVWLWRRSEARSVRSVAGLGIGLAALVTAFDAAPALIG